MHPRTAATLDELNRADWFCNVGTPSGIEEPSKYILLRSWDEAVESCASLEWENLCLEAVNQYRQRLLERSPQRYSQWNVVADSVKDTADELVYRKIEAVVRDYNLPQSFVDTVRWDIFHVCAEAEYADVFPAGFYASQAFWYVRGHFPCGWRGDFPQGSLVLF